MYKRQLVVSELYHLLALVDEQLRLVLGVDDKVEELQRVAFREP